jgi:hypothetical protein
VCINTRFVFRSAEPGDVCIFIRGAAGRCGVESGALADQGIHARLCAYEYKVECVVKCVVKCQIKVFMRVCVRMNTRLSV